MSRGVERLRAASLLESEGAFVVPSTHGGQTILRLCIVNPCTPVADVRSVLATLA